MPTIDGVEYERVFVSELRPGMVDSFGAYVTKVERITDDRTRIEWDGEYGSTQVFGHADTTILIEASTIEDDDDD
jgi:hypothetical protein